MFIAIAIARGSSWSCSVYCHSNSKEGESHKTFIAIAIAREVEVTKCVAIAIARSIKVTKSFYCHSNSK